MDNIKLYEISRDYVEYLSPAAPYLFHNSQTGQINERKYIGIVANGNSTPLARRCNNFASLEKMCAVYSSK